MTLYAYLRMLGFSLIGSFITTFTYAAASSGKLSLQTLLLPAVAQIAALYGLVTGLLMSPLFYWCLKDKNLGVVPVLYVGAVLLTASLTLMNARVGYVGAFIYWIAILLIVKFFGPPKV